MQRVMLRLDSFVRRHQRIVLVGWLVVLVAAMPFAMRQSEDLSAGGFNVPGSQSQVVSDALERDYPDAPRSFLGAVVVPGEGATTAEVRDAILRVERAAKADPSVELTAATRDKGLQSAQGGGPVVLPF